MLVLIMGVELDGGRLTRQCRLRDGGSLDGGLERRLGVDGFGEGNSGAITRILYMLYCGDKKNGL